MSRIMVDRRQVIRRPLAFILCLLASLLGAAGSYGSPETGAIWLSNQMGTDGMVSESASVHATPFQGAVEMLLLGPAGIPEDLAAAVRNHVFAADSGTTETIARQIAVAARSGLPLGSRIEQLYAAQDHDDGGFGDLPGYQSNALDTALALEALATAGLLRGEAANYAVAYLLSTQQADGSWQLNHGVNDHRPGAVFYVTAKVLAALHLYRHTYSVFSAIDAGHTWLLSNRDAQDLWLDALVSSQVLISLIPLQADISSLTPHLEALQFAQRPDGDWAGDVFTTALALRAIGLASQPRTNPDEIQIRGRVLDGDTGLGLEGVTVSVSGAQTASVQTSADGAFLVRDLAAGDYSIGLTRSGYGELLATTTAVTGSLIDLGDLRMLRGIIDSEMGVLRGTVTDATDGSPIADARIYINDNQVSGTGADGTYQALDLPPGAAEIRVQATHYDDSAATTTIVAGSVSVFSPVLVRTPQPDPQATRVIGTIVDADTGTALTGVSISLIGTETRTAQSDASGAFAFAGVPAGTYQLVAELTGYTPINGFAAVALGEVSDFGIIRMPRVTDPDVTTGAVRGIVTAADTGEPLAGAVVNLAGVGSVVTSSGGEYEFIDVPAGSLSISASSSGYTTVSGTATLVGGGLLVFSPALQPDIQPDDVVVQGIVLDAATGAPLAGVKITATGTNSRHTWTLADGSYRLESIEPGLVRLATEYSGYQAVTAEVTALGSSTVLFSPVLYAEGQPSGDANSASVAGRLIDAATNLPISGASVELLAGEVIADTQTDINGMFNFGGLTTSEALLVFQAAGYEAADYPVVLQPLMEADIGEVRLRPEGITALLPNLVVSDVDWSARSADPQTLITTGLVMVTLTNTGNTDAQESKVTVGAGGVLLGSNSVARLAPGEQAQVVVPVSGVLPFRDAPLFAAADADGRVVEINEEDNRHDENMGCHLEAQQTPSVTPVQKWIWRPSKERINSSPAVGPLIDTNGDGRINAKDDTYVVAVAGPGIDGSAGWVYAFRGRDKKLLWKSTAETYNTAHLAVGDIDGDGIPEVVAFRYDGGVFALDNEGVVKWEVILTKLAPTGITQRSDI